MIAFALIPLLLALWQPTAGIALIAAALPAYLIRFSVFHIPTTLLEVSLLAAVVGTIVRQVTKREFVQSLWTAWQLLRPYRWIFLALIFSGTLSAWHAFDERAAWGAWKAWYVDAVLLAALICIVGRRAIPWLLGGLTLGSSALSVYGLWEFFFAHSRLEDGRLNSVFGTPNYHALLVVPLIVLFIGWTFGHVRWRWWFITAALVNIAALFFTFSYGGYLGFAAGALVLALGSFSSRQRRWAVGAVAALVLLLSLSQLPTAKFRRLGDLVGRSSSHVRIQIWQASWRIIREHPVVGVGLGNYEHAYREAIPHIVFPPLEWLVALPHNLALAIASQTGVIGLAVLALLFIQFFRLCRRLPHGPGLALTASMVAILVHGLVDTPFYKNDLALEFMVLIALSVLVDPTGLSTKGGPADL